MTLWTNVKDTTPFNPPLVTLFLTTADVSPWTVPADWNDANNAIHVIGAGGGGGGHQGDGGGGGAYSSKVNISLTPSSTVEFFVGVGGQGAAASAVFPGTAGANGSNSWFGGSSLETSTVGAQGGRGGYSDGATDPLNGGGRATNGVGDIKFNGGDGFYGTTWGSGISAGGGGGAGGPNGAGARGGEGAPANPGGSAGGGGADGGGNGADGSGSNGGNGGSPTGGTGSSSAGVAGTDGSGGGGGGGSKGATTLSSNGGNGGMKSNWTRSSNGEVAGAGGGGGGGESRTSADGYGGNGGGYGGGGGGFSCASTFGANSRAGNGANGIIVIIYKPAFGPDPANTTNQVIMGGTVTSGNVIRWAR